MRIPMSVSKRANGRDAEMAGIFDVKITGLDGIRKDVYRVKKSLKQPINNGLTMMGDAMVEPLQRHIKEDWYDQYEPHKYKRRTDDSSLGRPMGDSDNMQTTVKDGALLFEYNPLTQHKNPDWDDHDPDLLIYRIQYNDKWKYPPECDERPFWRNFVDEMRDSNTLPYAFRAGFGNVENVKLVFEGKGKDIVFEPGEGEIKLQDSWNAFDTFDDAQLDAFGNEVDDYFDGGWDGDELDF